MAWGTVFGWQTKYRESGPQPLRARPVPGKPPKLNGAQLRRPYTLTGEADPRQLWLWFEFARCTREMACEPIRREFGARLPAASLRRLLRRPRVPRQRPRRRAWQADPAAMAAGRPRSFLPSAPTYALGSPARLFGAIVNPR
jgi:transposase